MSMSRSVTWVVLCAGLLTTACTGGSGGGGDVTVSLGTPACENGLIAHRLGLAGGAVHELVWKPYSAGALAQAAATRSEALGVAREASKLAAAQLTRAAELVRNCPAASVMEEPLRTAASRASAADEQLAQGTVNAELLGGLDSAMAGIESQASSLGMAVVERTPTRSELAAVAAAPS
ncbi:MAG TPA: hypothetical protein VFP72_20630 [Kineosporiaceae bacterium]|nr:hypothetical protein [Kineosporiaceae bacterium]